MTPRAFFPAALTLASRSGAAPLACVGALVVSVVALLRGVRSAHGATQRLADREMLIRVRDLLRAALPATLSLKDIGDRLHQSPRTIHRRLGEEGTSFRAIKDALRRDIALSRLTKTHDSIAKVAADLGYADTSAFYRAFVEWTGMAPVRYRRRCAEGT